MNDKSERIFEIEMASIEKGMYRNWNVQIDGDTLDLLKVVTSVAVVSNSFRLLCLLGSRQTKVTSSNMPENTSLITRSVVTAGPFATETFGLAVDELVSGEVLLALECFTTGRADKWTFGGVSSLVTSEIVTAVE